MSARSLTTICAAARQPPLHALLILMAGLIVSAVFPVGRALGNTLHQFCLEAPCTDGQFPRAALMNDGHDHFYGTTQIGGANGRGVLFEVAAGSTINVLHNFCEQTNCTDGSMPLGTLAVDASGTIYGTTGAGGTSSEDPDGGAGTVFKFTPGNGSFEVIYNFCTAPPRGSCKDGAFPQSGVIVDGAGNLYGTTESGGNSADEWGAVYQLTPHVGGYTESVLWSFCAHETTCITDGANPFGGLVMDSDSNLYGTTACGGGTNTVDTNTCGSPGGGGAGGAGIAFKLSFDGTRWKEQIIHRFCQNPGCSDGGTPFAGLIMDGAGNLYGTASQGGNFAGGTAFELTLGMFGWSRTTLHHFCHRPNCADGYYPYAPLFMDGAGNLYGTTVGQLTQTANLGGGVFKLTKGAGGAWTELVLHRFCGQANCSDGIGPFGSVVMDSAGRLLGTTAFGGSYSGNDAGSGVVFRIPLAP